MSGFISRVQLQSRILSSPVWERIHVWNHHNSIVPPSAHRLTGSKHQATFAVPIECSSVKVSSYNAGMLCARWSQPSQPASTLGLGKLRTVITSQLHCSASHVNQGHDTPCCLVVVFFPQPAKFAQQPLVPFQIPTYPTTSMDTYVQFPGRVRLIDD